MSVPEQREDAGPAEAGAPTSGTPLIRRLGLTAVLGVMAVALPPIGGFALIAYMGGVSDWLRSHQETGILIYSGAFIVLAGLALLPTYAQAALGGFAFGMLWGLPAALIGFTGGAMLGYEIARRASGDKVLQILKEKPKWQAVRDALVKDHETRSFWKTLGMVALLRCPPHSPFALTNLVMASVGVPRVAFVIGTLLGMIPRTAVAVYLGHAIGMSGEGKFEMPLWLWGSGMIAMLAVFVVVMEMADRAVNKMIASGEPVPYSKTLPKKIFGALFLSAVIIGFMLYRDANARKQLDSQAAPVEAVSPLDPRPR
jgi:uncharacterized membrane protein YdjX (TVP38/TMEM64 family)